MAQAFSILLVDDSPDHAALMRDILQPLKMVVHLANSGNNALEMLLAQPYDILLTDLAMPGMDGMTLLKKVRVLYPAMPVIVITCYGDVRSAVQAMQAGAFSYFTKGGAADELLKEVRRAFRCIETNALDQVQNTSAKPACCSVSQDHGTRDLSLKEFREQAEAEHIISVLNKVGGSRTKAAKALGITYRQLYNRLKDLMS